MIFRNANKTKKKKKKKKKDANLDSAVISH